MGGTHEIIIAGHVQHLVPSGLVPSMRVLEHAATQAVVPHHDVVGHRATEFDDTEVLEVAIIENIQRADLNAVEEAAGYKQLMERFGHTQEKLAEALGKSRSHIANLLRLLSLPKDVQALVVEGKLSAGHARALITAENPSELARIVVRDGLSVRQTEALVKKQQNRGGEAGPARSSSPSSAKDADTRALEKDLSAILAMKVVINHKPGTETGQVVLTYENLDQLDDLCAKLSR